MRVLFLEDVTNVADAGEVKEVASGFARNYLIPQNLATIATADQLKRVNKLKRAAEEKRVKEKGDRSALARILEGTTLHIPGKVGPTGRFYGAISVTRIIEELETASGQRVPRRTVELSDPIREPGKYEINLRLHQSVSATITVIAQAEGREDADDVEDEADTEPDDGMEAESYSAIEVEMEAEAPSAAEEETAAA